MKPYRGSPMTLGVAVAAGVRLIVWCKKCQHQIEPDLSRWLLGTAPRRPCSTGASGWSVTAAAADRSMWR